MKEREQIMRKLPKIAHPIAIAIISLSVAAIPAEAASTNFSPLPDYHNLTVQHVQNEVSIKDLIYGPAAFFLSKSDLLPKVDFEISKPTPTPTELLTPVPKPISIPQENSVTAQSIATGEIPDEVFDNLAKCESGQNWQDNSGNGFYGGLQFLPSTWGSVGGRGLPSNATREEQIFRARILQKIAGWGQWPVCSRLLGLLSSTS